MRFSEQEGIHYKNGANEKYEITSAFSLKNKQESLLGHSVKERIESMSVITFEELNDMY